jgi:UDP:flavonoid glycosyltransferase YjiC (YdhE family)
VPAVVVPFNNDQKNNAWLIKKNRVGIALDPAQLTGRKLRSAVEIVLQDVSIKENLQRFKTILSEIAGPENAAKEIVSVIEQESQIKTDYRTIA